MIYSDNGNKIIKLVLAVLPDDRFPTEQEVRDSALLFAASFQVEPSELVSVIRYIQTQRRIEMGDGIAITDESTHRPWLLERKRTIDPFYWERYREYLQKQGLPSSVLNKLDTVTDDLLDLIGDPRLDGHWMRRGLVVGDVQSGKTATYTGVITKAADAGYRLIILLTGTLEALRQQTQRRIDDGFVGVDSTRILATPRQLAHTGVGWLRPSRNAIPLTSRANDFNASLANQYGKIEDYKEPLVFVIKKNTYILKTLKHWLVGWNTSSAPNAKIALPVLLIDDEADSASVNTREAEDPATINRDIRHLLAVFSRSSYCGFTATPFANVFIDPDDPEEVERAADLFPSDYVYSLEPPTNYIGPREVFGERATRLLREIDDADEVYPPRHGKAHVVDRLPASLGEALLSFVIANAIRDLRGHRSTHRSMLVNVSRITAVQNQTADLIANVLEAIKRDVRNYGNLPVAEARQQSDTVERLHTVWSREFVDAGFEWPDVQAALNNAVAPVVVRSINQENKDLVKLDYDGHREHGFRVIAVGGNSLSRGLTLEGLSTSYFFRNSQMYDTLLQMGRWFGYRDEYEDVCRIFLTAQARDWYEHITEATEELRREFVRMRNEQRTPLEFGLKVQAHPETLLVTARNKMRYTKTIVRTVSLSGQLIEAARLSTAPSVMEGNLDAVRDFLEMLASNGIEPQTEQLTRVSHLWKRVPVGHIVQLLSRFRAHPLSITFDSGAIAGYLASSAEPMLKLWDVAIAAGNEPGHSFTLSGRDVFPVTRNVDVAPLPGLDGHKILRISGSKLRVGSGGAEIVGLEEAELRAAEPEVAEFRKLHKPVPDSVYRRFRQRPLLLIYPIRGFIKAHKDDKNPKPFPSAEPFMSLGMSMPAYPERVTTLKYVLNAVELRNLLEESEAEDEPTTAPEPDATPVSGP